MYIHIYIYIDSMCFVFLVSRLPVLVFGRSRAGWIQAMLIKLQDPLHHAGCCFGQVVVGRDPKA